VSEAAQRVALVALAIVAALAAAALAALFVAAPLKSGVWLGVGRGGTVLAEPVPLVKPWFGNS